MADNTKREERREEIYKSKSSSTLGAARHHWRLQEQMAPRYWRSFSPEGRNQVHNEPMIGPAVQARLASPEHQPAQDPIQYK
jgi:hypothetical protein